MESKNITGLGDTVARITHFFKLDLLAKWIAKKRGKKDCGCERRRVALNKAVPYVDVPVEQYMFTGSRKFRVLEDFTIPNGETVNVSYMKDEVIFINPSYAIYYRLRDLLARKQIKPEE